jgi:hypothetical protein
MNCHVTPVTTTSAQCVCACVCAAGGYSHPSHRHCSSSKQPLQELLHTDHQLEPGILGSRVGDHLCDGRHLGCHWFPGLLWRVQGEYLHA